MNKIELLAPAGDLQRLKVAVDYGADAVFIGGKKFSLRSRASNFDLETIKEAVNYAHNKGARVFVTANMILHDDDFKGLEDYLIALDSIGVDAVIVASFAVVELSKRVAPKMEVHISTQYSITNSATIDFYHGCQADRVVLAREHSLTELQAIVSHSSLPIEVFIHGGMCVNYSGRCTLSNYMTSRDANRGGCAQSCRWKYHIYDEGNELTNTKTLFSMSSKDLNAIASLPDLIEMGVASLKIEGRMKTDYYIATIVGAYRKAIDDYYRGVDHETIIAEAKKELKNAENRETFSGFYLSMPDQFGHLYGVNGANVNQNYVGTILDYDSTTQRATLQIRNHFSETDELEVFGPYHRTLPFYPQDMKDSQQEPTTRFYKPMEIVTMKIEAKVEKNDYIRKVMKS